jgi:hypothetical protein
MMESWNSGTGIAGISESAQSKRHVNRDLIHEILELCNLFLINLNFS